MFSRTLWVGERAGQWQGYHDSESSVPVTFPLCLHLHGFGQDQLFPVSWKECVYRLAKCLRKELPQRSRESEGPEELLNDLCLWKKEGITCKENNGISWNPPRAECIQYFSWGRSMRFQVSGRDWVRQRNQKIHALNKRSMILPFPSSSDPLS